MFSEVSDFLHYCRIERRLADLTCSAYERDATARVRFLIDGCITELQAVRPSDLRRFPERTERNPDFPERVEAAPAAARAAAGARGEA